MGVRTGGSAGYGASVVVIGLGLAWWYRNKPYKVFSAGVEAAFFWSSLFLCLAIIAFGPITGVVAAGLIFGDYKSAGAGAAGIRCRIAASYGLLVCNTLINILVAATTIIVFTYSPNSRGAVNGGKPYGSRKNPKLGCTGVAALYETKAFVWQNDHYFYLLDTLPEMLATLVFSWPYLLARMASCFPKDEVEKSQDVEARSSAGKKAGAIGNGTIASEQPAAGMV